MLIANAQQIREADRKMIEDHAFPGLLLMEAAGKKAADFILWKFPAMEHFLILLGPGNNGGDGCVIARQLHLAEKKVSVLLSHSHDQFKGDAQVNYLAIKNSGIEFILHSPSNSAQLLSQLPQHTLIIDALLGTGATGSLREPISEIVSAFRGTGFPTVAIDMPSGINSDTGFVTDRPIKAEYSVTFHLPKLCHYLTPASEYCGHIIVADIGIAKKINSELNIQSSLITPDEIRASYQPRNSTGHKGSYGHILFAGGSRKMAGAISLSAQAGLKSGAGLVTALLPESARCAFYEDALESMTEPYGTPEMDFLDAGAAELFRYATEGKNVIVIGPGLGRNEMTAGFLKAVLPMINVPLILDADALNLLADDPSLWKMIPENTILTPHPGEMRRLTGEENIQDYRMESAIKLAVDRQVIVVLKGAGTVIAFPDGKLRINSTGNPGMGTGGSGDVLTGCIAAWIAQGYDIETAVAMAVYLHGYAGDLSEAETGPEAVTAGTISSHLGIALKNVLEIIAPEPILV